MQMRVVAFILPVLLTLSLFGCVHRPDPAPTQVQTKQYPYVTGTFMQPGAFSGYSKERMTQHLQYLKEIGIDLLIVQSIFNATDKVSMVYFDAEFAEEDCGEGYSDASAGFLENVLAAAKDCDMQVYIGLANDADWWKMVFTEETWLRRHTELSVDAAEQIYQKYKSRYPETLTGWYFWPEYWNKNCDEAETAIAAGFLADYRKGLAAIDAGMPMLLSPFISTAAATPEETGRFWRAVLADAQLKPGDIFCCQDSVGAGHIQLEQLDEYFSQLKSAVDTVEGLQFWANNEDFTPEFKPARMDRFLEQLTITHKYAEKHISFAFCHYRNPDVGKSAAYEAYRLYYENGKLAVSKPKAPTVNIESVDRGRYVHIDITLDNSDGEAHSVVVTKDGVAVDTVLVSGQAESEISCRFTDENVDTPACQISYAVYVVDHSGNASDLYFEKVSVFTHGA